ncbi:MAG: Fur family transcriptional regulator [Burkholderiales bacterium]
MSLALDALNVQLSQRGYKLTRQRRAVVAVVAQGGARLSAADVYTRARRACPDLGLTTVYRTLVILAELGAIRRVHLDDGCEEFAPASAEHGHHLICSRCNQTVEFEDCDMAAMFKRVEARTGFRVEKHWLELVGRCPKCQHK